MTIHHSKLIQEEETSDFAEKYKELIKKFKGMNEFFLLP